MEVKIKNFGDILISRPAGRESFLMAKSYVFTDLSDAEPLVLNFEDIKVMTPSWLDEFISGLKNEYKNTVSYINTDNETVKASLKTVLEDA